MLKSCPDAMKGGKANDKKIRKGGSSGLVEGSVEYNKYKADKFKHKLKKAILQDGGSLAEYDISDSDRE